MGAIKYTYSFELSDKTVYVGLTSHLHTRKLRHLSNHGSSALYLKIKSGISYTFKTDGVEHSDITGPQKEIDLIEKYRDEGWGILNINKGGSLGRIPVKWTTEECKRVSLLCKSRYEMSWRFPSAYKVILKNKWASDCYSHMKNKSTRRNGYWTLERCKKEALKYNRRSEFSLGSPSAYSASHLRNELDIVCKHMKGRALYKVKGSKNYIKNLS